MNDDKRVEHEEAVASAADEWLTLEKLHHHMGHISASGNFKIYLNLLNLYLPHLLPNK